MIGRYMSSPMFSKRTQKNIPVNKCNWLRTHNILVDLLNKRTMQDVVYKVRGKLII